ncbi:MAG TPA: hypothetical protein VGR48_08645, partial [Terriglobales bacterium]|nr:hypothetical protein [Terriglobales bacterium]
MKVGSKSGLRLFPALGAASVALGLLIAAGCTVGPRYSRPTAPVPPVYKESGAWKQAQSSEQALGGDWWLIFNDPQLNALEQQVNISNQNLKAA